MSDPRLLSAEDWLKEPDFAGITVLDPDGWDRQNYEASWAEKLTLDQFESRLKESTCMWSAPIGAKAPACL